MSPAVFGIVLFAAALHAGWNAIVKAAGDKMLTAATVTASSALVAALAIPFVGVPASASWIFAAGSVALQFVYYSLLARAYHVADMSRTYPLMRGTAPLIVTAFGMLFLGEHLSALSLAGVATIGIGILAMTFDASGADSGAGRKLALANAVVIAGYTLIDGAGVRLSGNPAAYVMWIFMANGVTFGGWVLVTRHREFRSHLMANWHFGLVGGLGTLVSYGLALWAMTQAPVAAVAALRETAILFGTLIAAIFLGERIGPSRIASAVAITVGAVLIRFG